MRSLAEAMSTKPAPIDSDDYMEDDDGDDLSFHKACLEEIDRYRRIDEWIPSHHNILSRTALDCKLLLVKAGATKLNFIDFLQYTRDGSAESLRLCAFQNLVQLEILKKEPILYWFFTVLGNDPSNYMRKEMMLLLERLLGAAAVGDNSSSAEAMQLDHDGLTIEQETSTDARRIELERKQTLPGAIDALKAELAGNEAFENGLWAATTSAVISMNEMNELLNICAMLYPAVSSMVVALKYPRYWECTKMGKVCYLDQPFLPAYTEDFLTHEFPQGKIRFSRGSRVRTTRMPVAQPRSATAAFLTPTELASAAEATGAPMPPPGAPKRSFTLKPPKKETPSLPSGTSSLSSGSSSSQPLSGPPPTETEKRPRLVLKFGKGGSSRSP